jgi:uncharacterized protein (TIGR02147 family)
MTPSVWDFTSYKDYLKAWIAAQPHRGHGSKAAMARAANCQTAYVSQVVLGSAHLSLEQAERIAGFLELAEEEMSYFLLLIQRERAGTEALKRFFSKQLKAMKDKRAQLKNRLSAPTELSAEAQATYFSSWIFPAVHLLVRMPEFGSREAIAKRLSLTSESVEEALQFLSSIGLVARKGERYFVGTSRMHLPHDSPLISKHHINWRLRAIRDLEIRRDESLHYSSAITISKKDAAAIRDQLLAAIESVTEVIKDSADEALYSFCLDFFEL